jgi:hypothetical protein
MSKVNQMTAKQIIDMVKRIADRDRYVLEFDDWVKRVKTSAGLGDTMGRILEKLLDKHEMYFKMAYKQGMVEVASLIVKCDQMAIFELLDEKLKNEKLEQENKMMKECLEMICLDNIYIGQDGWKDEYFLVVKNAKECLNKLTKDER